MEEEDEEDEDEDDEEDDMMEEVRETPPRPSPRTECLPVNLACLGRGGR